MTERMLEMPGICEVHVVAGEYDMVAVIRVADNQSLSELITGRLIHTPGVHRTKTLVALRSHSPFDLEQAFGQSADAGAPDHV
jgi:DNA-binding Lrp family transcriptional regulator